MGATLRYPHALCRDALESRQVTARGMVAFGFGARASSLSASERGHLALENAPDLHVSRGVLDGTTQQSQPSEHARLHVIRGDSSGWHGGMVRPCLPVLPRRGETRLRATHEV